MSYEDRDKDEDGEDKGSWIIASERVAGRGCRGRETRGKGSEKEEEEVEVAGEGRSMRGRGSSMRLSPGDDLLARERGVGVRESAAGGTGPPRGLPLEGRVRASSNPPNPFWFSGREHHEWETMMCLLYCVHSEAWLLAVT